ncbi:TPA: Crp/Fnr family transcriptional regulator [bacterium UBP9_UBA11836]|nr:Crp/Fnr family transcriptional regulator [bacterium UBP9_UBA11836]
MERLTSPIFIHIDEQELLDMQFGLRRSSFSKGAVIFRYGQIISELGIVVKGSVNIESLDLAGGKTILSHIGIGQIFAETYAFCHEPMMVEAIADKDCEILFVNIKALLKDNNSSRSWYIKLLKNLLNIAAHKNLTLSNRIFCTAPKTIRGRLLTYLANLSAKQKSQVLTLPFNRQQLADYLNLDRSALSKELGKMRDEGLISFHKNVITLLQ